MTADPKTPSAPVAALRESHRAWRLPMHDSPTLDVSSDVREIRCALIEEEAAEFREALEAGDLVEVADAIADLLYVVYGAAVTFGIPIDEVFSEVHRSNMTKLGADGVPIYREDGKVLKGPSFEPPDVLGVLATHAPDPETVEQWRRAHHAFLERRTPSDPHRPRPQ
jgi:predicted HAD superfamily Cof-like phosphohydrolase